MKDKKRICGKVLFKYNCAYRGIIGVCVGMVLLFVPLHLFGNTGTCFTIQQKSISSFPSTSHKTPSVLIYSHNILQISVVVPVCVWNILTSRLTAQVNNGVNNSIQGDEQSLDQEVSRVPEDGYYKEKEFSIFWIVVITLALILLAIIMAVRRKNKDFR